MKVNFYEEIEDSLLKFAVIVAKSQRKWVFCKHKDRITLEIPGGHREKRESILQTAKRELKEETGAIDFSIKPICVYSVTGKNRVNESGNEIFGMLYYADIQTFESKLDSEIEKIELLDELPTAWTYPQIQPLLLAEVQRRISEEM
ncbi:MAG: NUDIX domain-containing protein [Lachnospiraceae bacterium]|nr:NUDIX domain-containing protein [Lachnospiraceae bacterium]